MRQTAPLLLALLASFPGISLAGVPEFTLEIRQHLFVPDSLTVPAGTKVRLRVINRDPTPEEFESYSLNREKVIMGLQDTVIYIGPLAPGRYEFFGEFNPRTAIGHILATES